MAESQTQKHDSYSKWVWTLLQTDIRIWSSIPSIHASLGVGQPSSRSHTEFNVLIVLRLCVVLKYELFGKPQVIYPVSLILIFIVEYEESLIFNQMSPSETLNLTNNWSSMQPLFWIWISKLFFKIWAYSRMIFCYQQQRNLVYNITFWWHLKWQWKGSADNIIAIMFTLTWRPDREITRTDFCLIYDVNECECVLKATSLRHVS